MAVIHLERLRVMAVIGVYAFEQNKRQPLFLDLKIHYDAATAALSDDIQHTVDYSMLEREILELAEKSRFALLESLGNAILDIALQHPLVSRARIRISKPEAVRFAENVSVCMKRKKS